MMAAAPFADLDRSLDELSRHGGLMLGVLESSGMAVLITDPRLPDNPAIFASPAFEHLTGYAREEIIGRNCRFLQTPSTSRDTLARIRNALATGSAVEAVVLNARKNGTPFWNRLVITPISGPDGTINFFIATQLDVTASLEAETVQAHHTGNKTRPFSTTTELGGAWAWDVRSGLLKADDYFAALHGLDPALLATGLPGGVFFAAIHPDDKMRIRMAVTGMLNGATVFSKDFRLVSPGGLVRWVHGEGQAHLDDEDTPTSFTGRLIDITEQKRIEERLRIAQTAGGIGTFEHIEGFATVVVSPQFCALLGLHQTYALPIATINALARPGEGNLIETRPGMAAGEIGHAEFRIIRADTGEKRWIARRSEMIRDVNTANIRHIGVIYDITIAKQRESELRDLNEQLEARVEERTRDRDRVWQNSRDLLVIMGADGIVSAVNPAWTRILGHDAQEVIGRNFFDFSTVPTVGGRRSTGQTLPVLRNFECCYTHKNGAQRWISWLTSREGDLIYAYGRHITDEKAKEEALHLERARLRAIFDTTSQLTGFTEPDGTIIVLNRACLEAMDVRMADVASRKFWDLPLFSGTPDMPEVMRAGIETAARGQTFSREVTVRLPDGNDHTYDFALRPVRDHTGQIIQIVPEAFDITVLRRTEALLRQSQKMEAIGQLTGGIAHDFNNMLTGISGALELIRRRIDAGQTHDLTRFMDAAQTSAQRAAALTHRLLAFARRQSLDAKPSDVNALVAGMEDLLHRALGDHVSVSTALGQGLWPALSDHNQLENALLNLAINARDAMPEGGRLTIETANQTLDPDHPLMREGLKPGDYVTIRVSDTGMGMPPGVLAKVFDPFFTTKPLGQGTGLGLSMVYGFVKQSGGHIDIQSAVDQGTIVKLLLPRATSLEDAPGDEETIVAPPGRGETVLVIEDDETVRLLIIEVLTELGYRHLEAVDSRTALPILQSAERVDLIVSDVGLPGLNGRQLAEIARTLRPGLKVLFVTGYAENAAIRSGFLEEGMEMIVKPFALDTLGAHIRKMIES